MAITEIGEWKLVPLIVNYKSKEAIKSIEESITDIGTTPGIFTEKLGKISDGDDFAVIFFKHAKKAGKSLIDKKIIVAILVNVTSTKNQEYFKSKEKTGYMFLPSINAGLIANWRDIFGKKSRESFDKIEQEEIKRNKKIGKETPAHKRMEIVLTYYKAQGAGKSMIQSLIEAKEGALAELQGLKITGVIQTKDAPVYSVVVEYEAGNTRQVSIVFEADGVKEGNKLIEEKTKVLISNAKSKIMPPGQQFLPPGFIKDLISKAEKITYSKK